MSSASRWQYLITLTPGHYRAAKIVLDQRGPQAEDEIFAYLQQMADCGNQEGAHLWLCVLAALQDLQATQPASATLH
jgi:hypothetical protein